MKKFNFQIVIDVDLSVEQVWPDGDAPENPTAADAERVFRDYGRGDTWDTAREWDLDYGAELTVSEVDG